MSRNTSNASTVETLAEPEPLPHFPDAASLSEMSLFQLESTNFSLQDRIMDTPTYRQAADAQQVLRDLRDWLDDAELKEESASSVGMVKKVLRTRRWCEQGSHPYYPSIVQLITSVFGNDGTRFMSDELLQSAISPLVSRYNAAGHQPPVHVLDPDTSYRLLHHVRSAVFANLPPPPDLETQIQPLRLFFADNPMGTLYIPFKTNNHLVMAQYVGETQYWRFGNPKPSQPIQPTVYQACRTLTEWIFTTPVITTLPLLLGQSPAPLAVGIQQDWHSCGYFVINCLQHHLFEAVLANPTNAKDLRMNVFCLIADAYYPETKTRTSLSNMGSGDRDIPSSERIDEDELWALLSDAWSQDTLDEQLEEIPRPDLVPEQGKFGNASVTVSGVDYLVNGIPTRHAVGLVQDLSQIPPHSLISTTSTTDPTSDQDSCASENTSSSPRSSPDDPERLKADRAIANYKV
ncbi:hypothetical protein QFC24_001017 [Naganishia onofrii]|uniref:Uncharacterized protein n=1 Tax=Naganishia onofrii TaxID=1851511 RepID=A0ACC2XXP3_9TREE|nr:hypothetical protein QFC24_001017 [Naganishia onofrii]